MDGNANDILKSFQLSTRAETYDTVNTSFEAHFLGRTVIIFEEALFNKRVQGEKSLWLILSKAYTNLQRPAVDLDLLKKN